MHKLLCSPVKFSLEQATKAQRGSRCIALLFLQPWRLMGVGGQRHAPTALPPGKTWYPLYRRLGGLQGRSGWVQKISPPTGIQSPLTLVNSLVGCHSMSVLMLYSFLVCVHQVASSLGIYIMLLTVNGSTV